MKRIIEHLAIHWKIYVFITISVIIIGFGSYRLSQTDWDDPARCQDPNDC